MSPNPGTAPLQEAIARYLNRNGRPMGPERIAVTASGVNALMLGAQALLDPGDEVAIPMPAWPTLDGIARVMGARVTPLPLRILKGAWRVDRDELLATVTPATRLIFRNSPGNTVGWTLSAEEQRAIPDQCRRTGIWILADDVHGRVCFAGDAAPAFAQHAGVVAPDHGDGFMAETRARYRACRDLAPGTLGQVPGVTAPRPDGTMDLFLRVTGRTDSMALAKSLLLNAGAGLAPGAAFGAGGEGHLRLRFAQREDRLRTACTHVAAALAAVWRTGPGLPVRAPASILDACREERAMPEPMDKPQFDALMARHGIPLTEAEREGIRAVSGHMLEMAARVRTPREAGAEMALTFAPKGATR